MANIDDEAARVASESHEEPYVPDPQAIWAVEKSRAMLIVLTRRFGGDFAREVHNEIFARAESDKDGSPDDRCDGFSLESHLADPFWDKMFAVPAPKN